MKINKSRRALLGAALAACTTTGVYAQVEAQTLMAIGHASDNFGIDKTVSFYDITELNSNTFAQPLFYVWTGYEQSQVTIPVLLPGNHDEISGLTFNPVNGMMYLASFDSGTPGTVDADPRTEDIEGDYDLYQIDLGAILDDYNNANSGAGRAAGVIYGPTLNAAGDLNQVHSDAGSTPGMVHLDAFAKVGEIARPQTNVFFDIDLEFINPETLVLVDNLDSTGTGEGNFTIDRDHTLRLWQRVNTAAGFASLSGISEGGYNGAETTQSWESRVLTELLMDGNGPISEVGIDLDDNNNGTIGDLDDVSSNMHGISLVRNQNGTLGVWVAENDAPDPGDPTSSFHDEFSFFEIDLAAIGGPTASKKEFQIGPGSPFGDSFRLDEDPTVDSTTNDGDADTYFVDPNGNLIIVESSFQDTPQGETRLIKRVIEDYDAADTDASGLNEIDFGAWSTIGVTPTLDDDTSPINGLFATYDPGGGNEGYVYLFDVLGESSFLKDVYVIDVETGAIVYEELDAPGITDIFFERHTNRIVTRGDATGDGRVTAADIDSFFAVRNSGNALMQEMYSLDGDLDTDNADVGVLVQGILGTNFGDADLDGDIDNADVGAVAGNFTGSGTGSNGWALGDFDGDGDTDNADVGVVAGNFTGAAAGNLTDSATVADLRYDPVSGNITLDATEAAGGVITSFQLENGNAGTFDPGAYNSLAGTGGFGGFFEDVTANTVGDSDLTFIGANGLIDLGDIAPTGLDLAALEAYLSTALYAGQAGSGQLEFDLVVIPEPSSLALLGLGGLFLTRRRRG